MGLPIEYHPAAENDVDEAVYYYARRVTALGAALHSEIEHVEHLVSEQPESGMPLRGDLRRYLLKRFPYALIYAVEPSRIYVVAIAHMRRRPGYWGERR